MAAGRGVSCVLYEGDNGYCSVVAEVEVNQDTGRVSVKRLVIANDCGPISNPDGLKNQLEGGALQRYEPGAFGRGDVGRPEGDVHRLAHLPAAVPGRRCSDDRNRA